MDQEGQIGGYTKVIWTGVTTLELAKAMEKAIQNNLTGLYHVVNNQKIDKYSLLQLFKKYFKPEADIEENPSYISNKSLISTRRDFEFNIPSYENMILDMKEWIIDHPELYEI